MSCSWYGSLLCNRYRGMFAIPACLAIGFQWGGCLLIGPPIPMYFFQCSLFYNLSIAVIMISCTVKSYVYKSIACVFLYWYQCLTW